MNIFKIPKLGRAKFVIVKDGEDFIFLADGAVEYHEQIIIAADLYKKECLGGGRLNISEEKIRAYDSSFKYGAPPQSLVETMLKEYIGDSPVELVVEMGKW